MCCSRDKDPPNQSTQNPLIRDQAVRHELAQSLKTRRMLSRIASSRMISTRKCVIWCLTLKSRKQSYIALRIFSATRADQNPAPRLSPVENRPQKRTIWRGTKKRQPLIAAGRRRWFVRRCLSTSNNASSRWCWT